MQTSLFVDLLDKYFPKFKNIVELINGSRKAQTYLFEQMLQTDYSADMKWESNAINRNVVAADVVAMDSTLPLKKRESLSHANGDLPKLGMKLKLTEKQLTDIQIMQARGVDEANVVRKLLNDAVRCTDGIKERLEFMFLKGLSDGVSVVADDYNVGTGIRVSYGYLDDNKFGVEYAWTDEEHFTPITDIKRVISEAAKKNNVITYIAIAKETYDAIRRSAEGKTLAATFAGAVYTNVSQLPVSTPTKFNEAFKDETGVEFIVIDRSVSIEKNGQSTPVKPWNKNHVIFLTSNKVGTLTYGTLAEENNPIEGVNYTKPNDYTLIKVYHSNDPYAEFTAAQALALPVIEGADAIYMMDITDAQTVTTTAGLEGAADTITLWNTTYEKADVIAALVSMGYTVDNDITDAALASRINRLSDAKEAELKAILDAE